MFQGFSKETGEFLWELSFHNERPWFLAHKEDFERVLNQPFRALARETAELMLQRFPRMEAQLHISRIYRDARRLFGRGPYKDHLWFTVKDGASYREGPCFWFEIGAATYSYGLGYFDVTPAEMVLFRQSIDANPARFARMAEEIEEMPGHRIIGEVYARPKGALGEPVDSWYNRKRVGVEFVRDLEGDAFSPALPRILADAYAKLMPMYEYLLQVHRAAGKAGRLTPEERKHE